MIKIFLIVIASSVCISVQAMEQNRAYNSKDEFLEDYKQANQDYSNSLRSRIEKEQANGSSHLVGALNTWRNMRTYNLSAFERSLKECDSRLWLKKDGKTYDCNELIEIYSNEIWKPETL